MHGVMLMCATGTGMTLDDVLQAALACAKHEDDAQFLRYVRDAGTNAPLPEVMKMFASVYSYHEPLPEAAHSELSFVNDKGTITPRFTYKGSKGCRISVTWTDGQCSLWMQGYLGEVRAQAQGLGVVHWAGLKLFGYGQFPDERTFVEGDSDTVLAQL